MPQRSDTQQVADVFSTADERIVAADRFADIYDAVTPTNWQQERERLLTGPDERPSFTYQVTDGDREQAVALRDGLSTVQDRLQEQELDGDQQLLRELYSAGIDDLRQKLRIIEHVGEQPDAVRDASQQIWGAPDRETVRYAAAILEGDAAILGDLLDDPMDMTVSSDGIRSQIDTLLDRYGLTDWTTTYTDSVTHVVPAQQVIRIHHGDAGRITGRAEQVLLHEFGVHVLRAANGWRQPHRLFAVGLHGYETTEEGLTSYIEYRTGYLTEQVLRQYALRTLAVDAVLDGRSFADTVEQLAQHTDTADAFYTAMRAHRGGGFVKDHIYLQGFRQVRDHLDQQDGLDDLRALYAGKIPLDALPAVRDLQDTDILRPPAHDIEQVIDHLLQDGLFSSQ